jgi:hypothetical protein
VNCGWANIIDATANTPVARGRLSVLDPPLPCPPEGYWEGELTLLRGSDALTAGDSMIWGLRSEDGHQFRWVEIRSVRPAWAPSGLHATAHIISCDDRFPAKVVELGGDR